MSGSKFCCSGRKDEKLPPPERSSVCETVFKREENVGRSSEKSREQELHSDRSQKPNSSSESESVQTDDDDDDEGGQRRLLHSEPQFVPLSCHRANHQFL